jgi:four helix bundle protein
MKDENTKPAELRGRTKQFALRIIRLYRALNQRDGVAQVIGRQMIRSGTSVAAHYREACRAKSNSDFINKLEGALQELDETALWLELLTDSDTMKSVRIQPLQHEVEELISIFVTMTRKVKAKR